MNFVNDTVTKIATGTYELNDVPVDTANLSAKTAWSLREKKVASLGVDGQGTCDFTGADMLRGGDLDGSNSVNILDYSIMRTNWGVAGVADINGDGVSNILDYSIMKLYWFKVGEAE